jgi:hypothetical protein
VYRASNARFASFSHCANSSLVIVYPFSLKARCLSIGGCSALMS